MTDAPSVTDRCEQESRHWKWCVLCGYTDGTPEAAAGLLASDTETVAQQVHADLIHSALIDVGDQWVSYPDIGEHDWNRVVNTILNAVPYPPHDRYLTAYGRLAARATEDPE